VGFRSKSTATSYRTRNDAAYPVSADMDLGVPYVVVTPEELGRLTASPDWHELNDACPGAKGFVWFSRVGFDSALEQAFVYVGFMYGRLGGDGIYYVMQKGESGWQVAYEQRAWIS
jgi:hypothetical protein